MHDIHCGLHAVLACGHPGGHAQGLRPIQRLHVGDKVLAEDPKSHKVQAERLQAVRHDPAAPLLAIRLSDGSAITATLTHAFWVDAGPGLAQAGWFYAKHLRVGDQLRTASGKHVIVAGLRYNAGRADVYTLTVARDHTFFVGTARVLVHNALGPSDLRYEGAPKHHENAGPGIGAAPANGQAALNNSVQVKATSTRRVGVDPGTGQIVVFDETDPGQGLYHGHVRTWDELTQDMKNALQRTGLVDRRGRPAL